MSTKLGKLDLKPLMSHELIQMAHRQICTHKISCVSEKYLLKTDTFLSNGKRRSQEKCCVRNEYVTLCPECLASESGLEA